MSMDLDVVSSSLENGTNSSKKAKKRKLAGEDGQNSKKRKKDVQMTEEVIPASSASSAPTVERKKNKKLLRRREVPDTDRSTVSQSEIRLSDAPPTADTVPHVPTDTDQLHAVGIDADDTTDQLPFSDIPAPFSSTRISLYLPIHAISLSSATSSLLSAHLAPLLLTYYPPMQGVVLAFSDPILSAKAALSSNLPLIHPSQIPQITPETLALTADEHGVSWVWLTVTLLVFSPETGMEVEGYVNTCTEGFVGLVSYNYFQTGITRNRIPESWRWTGPGGTQNASRKKKGKKCKLKDSDSQGDRGTPISLNSQEPVPAPDPDESPDDGLGFFTDEKGNPVRSRRSLRFRVVDSDIVPVHGRDRSLQIEGTLLSGADETGVLEEEALKFDQLKNRRGQSRTPAKRISRAGSEVLMSGGIGLGREDSTASVASATPRKHRLAY